jgi:hypothetical protein
MCYNYITMNKMTERFATIIFTTDVKWEETMVACGDRHGIIGGHPS